MFLVFRLLISQKLYLNDNPLQNIPIALSECNKLTVLDLSNTYVRRLPREMYYVKGFYELNLDGCPLDDDLAQVYSKGIVATMSYFKDLMFKAIYRVIEAIFELIL